MSTLFKKQQQQVAVATQFQKVCFTQGLHIDLGQAFECELELDPVRKARLARRFHHQNIRNEHSAGAIHFSSLEDDYFDLSAPEKEEEPEEDAEEKLREIMVMCPALYREKIAALLMEMKRPGGPVSINSAALAVGVSRSGFYKIIRKIRRWAMRPPTPDGWSGTDCSLLLQMSLDFWGEK